jgi:hypothetical protein
MTISKDESIITQVAAKIAADLIPPDTDVNMNIANWNVAFEAVRDALFSAHGTAAQSAMTQVAPSHISDPVAVVNEVFPNTAPVAQPQFHQAPTNMSVAVKGTQHGPLPDWLMSQAAKAGVSAVWDNRDGLAQNPKRPWFKAADGTKDQRGQDVAFWPPRGR